MEPRKWSFQSQRPYHPSFHMHFKDPNADWEMVEAFENLCRVEGCMLLDDPFAKLLA